MRGTKEREGEKMGKIGCLLLKLLRLGRDTEVCRLDFMLEMETKSICLE